LPAGFEVFFLAEVLFFVEAASFFFGAAFLVAGTAFLAVFFVALLAFFFPGFAPPDVLEDFDFDFDLPKMLSQFFENSGDGPERTIGPLMV